MCQMKYYLLIAVLLLFSNYIQAQNSSTLDSILTANKYTFQIEDGMIVGDGFDFIVNEATNSQFFMVGELHGNVETPTFTSAILAPLKKLGYNQLALEIGPYSNKKIQSILNEGGISSLADFYENYSLNDEVPIPFFWAMDEAEMLRNAYSEGYKTWGIDQEFVYAAPFLFDDIYKRILTFKLKSEEAVYTEVYKKALDKVKELLWSEDRNRYQMIFTDNDINAFLLMSNGYDSETDDVIKALQKSWRIYEDNALRRSFRNNNTRIELFKEYFNVEYKKVLRSEKKPKVLVKMGSMHTVYGYSAIGIYDIGNYLRELAIFNNSKSFNIALAGRYYIRDTGERIDRLEFVPEYEGLFKHEDEGDENWTILDLRPVKIALIDGTYKIDDRAFMNLLLRYDAVLLKTLHRVTRHTVDINEGG